MTGSATQQVRATPAALELIERLTQKHGPVVFFQSGGCCDGTAAMCLSREDMPPGSGDTHLGEIGGAPFYVDTQQYDRWGRPEFVIDVAEGEAGGFSLEGPEGVRFVTLSPREADGSESSS